ncbi:Hypothetical protein POVR2_LOCUS345 [uncultured virus]|nr:Hypothetical protein POVR2_LOCUS345 [uncultured virus]
MPSGGRSEGLSKEQVLYLASLQAEGDYESLEANLAELERTRRQHSVSEVLEAYQNRDMRVLQYVLVGLEPEEELVY